MEYVNKDLAKVPYWLMISVGLTFGILTLITQVTLYITLGITSLRDNLIKFVPFLLILFVILRIIGDTGITGLKVDKYSRNKQYSKAESLLDKKIKSPFTKPFKRRRSKLSAGDDLRH